jgi:hypothetical protein
MSRCSSGFDKPDRNSLRSSTISSFTGISHASPVKIVQKTLRDFNYMCPRRSYQYWCGGSARQRKPNWISATLRRGLRAYP